MPKEKSQPTHSTTDSKVKSSFAKICQQLSALSKEEYEGEIGRNLLRQCEALNKLLPKNTPAVSPKASKKQNPLNNTLRFDFKSSPNKIDGKKIVWRSAEQTPGNNPNPIAEILSIPAKPGFYI